TRMEGERGALSQWTDPGALSTEPELYLSTHRSTFCRSAYLPMVGRYSAGVLDITRDLGRKSQRHAHTCLVGVILGRSYQRFPSLPGHDSTWSRVHPACNRDRSDVDGRALNTPDWRTD